MSEELSFEKRDLFAITYQQPDGWWHAEKWDETKNVSSGDKGMVPMNFVERIG